MYQLVKLNSRSYAIYDISSHVYYFGKKSDLIKRLLELNKK